MFDGCCCIEGGEKPEFWRCETRLAKREYHCCECSAMIKPSDRHEYVVGKWDGSMGTYRTCVACTAVRKDLMRCGFTYTMLWEDLRECFGDEDDDDWLRP